jgi:hypothetical protein
MAESALVVLVPEAERLVVSIRAMYDPVASKGMPAHITILYPFVDPGEIDDTVLKTLTDYFGSSAQFRCSLAHPGEFPGILYLVPEPSEPFVRLTQGLSAIYPEHPPYLGAFAEIVPHLTVAEIADRDRLQAAVAVFERNCLSALPIEVSVSEVWLMVGDEDTWLGLHSFPLGGC